MSVLLIAQLKITNDNNYRRYQSQFASIFSKFSGCLLAADEHPVVLEGTWTGDKVVVMSFADQQQARSFLQSSEYLEISQDRVSGTQTMALLVQGLA